MSSRKQIWSWRDGQNHVLQAETYSGDFGLKLIVKRYSLREFNQPMPGGTHQTVYNSAVTPGSEEAVLRQLGWSPTRGI